MKPTETKSWKNLSDLKERYGELNLRELFVSDPARAEYFNCSAGTLFVDFSKNLINAEIFSSLIDLAKEMGVEEKRDKMFAGEAINTTENRPVLHTALRNMSGSSIIAGESDVMPSVNRVLDKMSRFSDSIRSGKMIGYTGKSIKNIVNIGIGGSDLGPVMATEALKAYSQPDLTVRFISNIDSTHFVETTKDLDPAETLFIIASKTFTTDETMTNAETAKKWLSESLGSGDATAKHFVAISTNLERTAEFGISDENVFEFWDWVGGRYSMTSAIGLPIMISIGQENFTELLRGYYEIDEHFKTAPLEKNGPVILALIGIWYTNFFNSETEAILPYEQYLHRLPAYLQQANMESNGKSIDLDGRPVDYRTGPIVWGEPGTNGQHAFYQLLHQGTHLVPADFIGSMEPVHNVGEHHLKLISNMFAQTEALAFGKTEDELRKEGVSGDLVPHKAFAGNRPSNTILLPKLSPFALGQLVSLYEHKIFVQGVIWNINSFDQWGVELGKVLAKNIYTQLKSGTPDGNSHDSSTTSLMRAYLKNR